MIKINPGLKPSDISRKLKEFWEFSAEKINLIEKHYDDSKGFAGFHYQRQLHYQRMDRMDPGVSIRFYHLAV